MLNKQRKNKEARNRTFKEKKCRLFITFANVDSCLREIRFEKRKMFTRKGMLEMAVAQCKYAKIFFVSTSNFFQEQHVPSTWKQ